MRDLHRMHAPSGGDVRTVRPPGYWNLAAAWGLDSEGVFRFLPKSGEPMVIFLFHVFLKEDNVALFEAGFKNGWEIS